MNIAILASQFNKDIVDRLVAGAKKALQKADLKAHQVKVFEVPGAFELPFAAQKIIDLKKFDGIVALGCILKGETEHYEAVCGGVTYGIQKISVEERFPIMLGVLMCRTQKQALARAQEAPEHNKGYESAMGLIHILNKF
ncbi:MAG: 6,7-dimethyl-8-ribityllumazine synthase [Patescibacteria group bacterium]